ncbi:putative RNA 3'-terminal phosphate cyclase-like protein [Raphanus sativus]|uniref:Probable RNA 3'-terminal phosphate cyclase-like protein n=1 Tax=Raphanus sativus TaxID=3726 RepID=A0A6J0KIQ0_RAPSA|nr:probable RNA 3'-terminal phosphate cyclase-like protein [Raphanus sativus]KAJ4881762.1 putative RNA 3'-terminal phosphate cyclase-like protein [Raphanus sativus]
MGKTTYKRLKGSQSFRQRLLLSTLSSTPIIIDEIRADDMIPGLLRHEMSLLRLFETVSDDCVVEVNETGTRLKYKPGIIMGGKNLVHSCALTRSMGYYLESLLVLGLFGKKPLSIRLKGVTDDPKDPSVDTVRNATLHILKRFGVPSEGLELKIEARGVAPEGGGEVLLTVPNVQSLTAVQWVEEGMVKRIRGWTFSARVSSDFEHSMRFTARGVFNNLLPDVHIFNDHKSGLHAGKSPGYGISLVAETTAGCYISADTAVSCGRVEETGELDVERQERKPAEDTGVEIASWLLQEIEKGGVVDSTHQGLLFILCALCQQDVSKVRVGTLSPYGVETLRNLKEFLGVTFSFRPDPDTATVILTCVGSGLINLSRKLS